MDTNEDENKLVWSALEYEDKERSKDWFWALGIVIVTAAATSIILSNYFFAVLLLLGGAMLGFFAVKKPEVLTYELNEKGLKIKDQIYLYEDIKSFWVQSEILNPREELDRAGNKLPTKPLLFIHSQRIFMPVISVPIDEDLAPNIQAIMLSQNVEEVEMKEHPSEKIMEMLGF